MSYSHVSLLRLGFIALIVVVFGTACSSSFVVPGDPTAQVQAQNVETAAAASEDTSTNAAGVTTPAVGSVATEAVQETATREVAATPTEEVVPTPTVEPEASPTAEPTTGPVADATAAPVSSSAFADAANRPLDERLAELAALEDADFDPKRVVDQVSLDSTWWGLGADVYPGDATPAGPLPEVGELTEFCDTGYRDGSPKSRTRAVRDWTEESAGYRRVVVSASAMLDAADAANSVARHNLLLEHCAGVVFDDMTVDVVDATHGQFLVFELIDSDFILVSSVFSTGSLVTDVSASGDAEDLEQLIADVEYGLRAAVDAVDDELERLGAVAQLRPDLQAELTRLDAFCQGHNQWKSSTGGSRTPLEHFEAIVGYYDGVEPPEELGEQFENFQSANAEMLEVVRLEPNLTEDELGEHPSWIELRERYNFSDALQAVWDFGRETC